MRWKYVAIMVALASFPGCGNGDGGGLGGAESGEPIGTSTRTVVSTNRLTLNRLTLNRLTLNELTFNQIALERVSESRLILDSRTSNGLENTEDGRELLHYLATCALADGTILVAHDAHGHPHEFPGLLGLAPEWEQRGLTTEEGQRMSACLLTHVNGFGVSVEVSIRAPGRILASRNEIQEFPVYEGTFFGQVFGRNDQPLAAYACQGDLDILARAHSTARELRVCTDPSSPCGITTVGRCRDVCEQYTDEYGWSGCAVTLPDGTTERFEDTVSAFLPADNPAGTSRVCGAGRSCSFAAQPGQAAVFDCTGAGSCMAICGADGLCTVDSSYGRARVFALPGAVTQVDCQDGYSCSTSCRGASCDIDCQGANSCAVRCTTGADCMLDCADTGAGSCGFSACDGVVTYCADGSIACNRRCPGTL